MINTKVLEMLAVINKRSWRVLETVMDYTLETSDFDDLDSLDGLYQGGWIDMVDERWIMTEVGRKLYWIVSDLVV